MRDFQDEEEEHQLQRSHRFVNYNEKDINEYVSSDEDPDEVFQPPDNKIPNGAVAAPARVAQSNGDFDFGDRARSYVFKPFRPGRGDSAMRQIPQSVLTIKKAQNLYQINPRKLPKELQEKQRNLEINMREQRMGKEDNKEALDRDAKIRAMLANIPCMNKESLAAGNRQNIDRGSAEQAQKQAAERERIQTQHNDLLRELKVEVLESASVHQKSMGSSMYGSPMKQRLSVRDSNASPKKGQLLKPGDQ